MRNEAIAGGRSGSRLFRFVEMEEMTVHLDADKDNSVGREILIMLERKETTVRAVS